MSRGGALVAALLATLARPSWWLLALATFSVRGGVVLFLLPIVVLPSPLAISNVVGPLIVAVAFGRIDGGVVAVAVAAVLVLLGWLLAGGWLAAAIEVRLVAEAGVAAVEEALRPARQPLPGTARRTDRELAGGVLAARLLASIPLAAAIGLGLVHVVGLTYAEVIRPSEVDSSLALRVAAGVAGELVVITLAWSFAEAVAGNASRRIVLDEASVRQALRAALRDLVRRPVLSILGWVFMTIPIVVVMAAGWLAAGMAWTGLVTGLSARTPDIGVVVMSVTAFVTVWLAGFLVTGVLTAVRSSAATDEFARTSGRPTVAVIPGAGVEGGGTFGAPAHHRPGDWSVHGDGGSL